MRLSFGWMFIMISSTTILNFSLAKLRKTRVRQPLLLRKDEVEYYQDADVNVEEIRRKLRTYIGSDGHGHSSDESDENGIYNAGSITQYNNGQLNFILRNHEYVAFTKKWRGADRLILTQLCTITGSRTAGGYYCVDGHTVCVAWSSMPRFYGQHTVGGPCGMLPLDDDLVNSLPDNLREAYYNTCDKDKCDGK